MDWIHAFNRKWTSKTFTFQVLSSSHQHVACTLEMTADVKTANPTTTATRYCASKKHLLFSSFSAPIGFSWNGSHVSLRNKRAPHEEERKVLVTALQTVSTSVSSIQSDASHVEAKCDCQVLHVQFRFIYYKYNIIVANMMYCARCLKWLVYGVVITSGGSTVDLFISFR